MRYFLIALILVFGATPISAATHKQQHKHHFNKGKEKKLRAALNPFTHAAKN